MKPLTVEDLIAKLKTMPKNAIVVTSSDNFEMNNAIVPARYISNFKGELVTERFRDAFDGDHYTAEVVKRRDKGEEVFIQIS